MAKQGKRRTMSICLTEIPKEKILIHENGFSIRRNQI